MDGHHFRRVDKFNGQSWEEFAFQFRTAVGSASSKIREVLDDIVKNGKDPQWDDILLDWHDDEMNKSGAELYAVLSSFAAGEAMTVVRGVPIWNGWEA